MKRKFFGTDGIRGVVGGDLINPMFVTKLGWAAGKVLADRGTKKVLIGKDTRISGYMLESALEAGFSAAGVDVVLLGPMPTPAIAYLTKTFRAEAGVVISASHNPYQDNGIKFFSSTGHKLDDNIELEIEKYLNMPLVCEDSDKLGKATRISDAAGRYIEYCKGVFPSDLSLAGMRIVVDCAHGATYHIAPEVLRELGAEVITVGTSPNGVNINNDVGATSLGAVIEAVKDNRADFGFALDGDGDRVMLIDHDGNVVDGDMIVFIIARHALRSGKLNGGVVGTKMTNLAMEKALQKLGVPFIRADVGDRYVMEQLKANQWTIGGENSGHVLNLEYSPTGDGIIAGLQVLVAMLKSDMSLKTIASCYDNYPQVLINVKYIDNGVDILNDKAVLGAVLAAEEEMGTNGRVLLRKSGTEPLIRVMVESNDEAMTNRLANNIALAVKSV